MQYASLQQIDEQLARQQIMYNQPEKINTSHICVLVSSFYMAFSLLLALTYIEGFFALFVFTQGYLVYIITVVCCHPSWRSLTKSCHISKYDAVYKRLQDMNGQFVFTSKSYHTENIHHMDERGNTVQRQDRVVTHRETERLNPICRDISGQLAGLDQGKNLILIEYSSTYRWKDRQSQANFDRIYSAFRARNHRDLMQDVSYSWKFEDYAPVVAFYTNEKPDVLKYKKFALMGLAYPYLQSLEKQIARYKILITKELSF